MTIMRDLKERLDPLTYRDIVRRVAESVAALQRR